MAQSMSVQNKSRNWRRFKEKVFDFGFAVPALLFFILLTYYPVVELFRYSLTDWNLMKSSYNYVGLKNYIWLFTSTVGQAKFLSTMKITLIYTVADVATSCFLGLLIALLFNNMSRTFKVMRMLVILPKYLTVSATSLVFLLLYNDDYGLLNMLLKSLGLSSIRWTTSSSYALLSVIIYSIWRSIGYAMMIYLSAIKGLNQDYFEAASLDGANSIQKFRYITIPLIAPTTLFLAVTSFLGAMKVFTTVDLLTDGGPYEATNVIVYWIYSLAFTNYRVDRAAAVGVVFFIILLLFTLLTMNVSDRKVNYDA